MSRKNSQTPFDRFQLRDAPVVRIANVASGIVMVCLALLIAWMVITPIDEVAKARGAIEPVTEVQRLQSEFGGAVASIEVREGDIVDEGDLLLVFDASDIVSQLRETRIEELSLILERERQLALVEGREPEFGQVYRRDVYRPAPDTDAPDGSNIAEAQFTEIDDAVFSQLVERAQAAFWARRSLLQNERQLIERQITAKEADLEAIDLERPALERQLGVAKEQVATQQSLVERGLAPRPALVAAVEAEADYAYQTAVLTGREAVLQAELDELRDSLEDVDLQQSVEAREEIAQINETILTVEEQVRRLTRRLNETEIRSPVAGIVQTVPDTVVGRFIEPGGQVAEIVPQDVALRFAAELGPRDIGFVSAGQRVNLKIDAFDFGRFGALEGRVVEVSPTTIVNERGIAFYEVLVDVPKTYFRDDPMQFALLPGMTGEADILTGKKTVFEYVWKPIYTNLDLALTER